MVRRYAYRGSSVRSRYRANNTRLSTIALGRRCANTDATQLVALTISRGCKARYAAASSIWKSSQNENRSIKQSVIRNPEMAVHRDCAIATFRNSEFEATFRGAQFPRACAIVLTLRFPKTEAKRRRSARWDASIVCSWLACLAECRCRLKGEIYEWEHLLGSAGKK